jgi:hypothetical protein
MNVLYKHITVPHSYVFSKFLNHLSKYPDLGRQVRRLDLSHFSSIGLGRTREMNKEIKNMTSQTLLQCLELMPNLQEILLQEHLDQDLDEAVLLMILTGISRLRALDLCGAYAGGFADSFSNAIKRASAQTARFSIQHLNLHECFTIRGADMELLLSRLPRLKILDVYHTRITNNALHSIPETAQLTHLNLGMCSNISGSEIARFLTTHPAAKELVYLNLSCDLARHRLLRASDLDIILPALPSTLRSLNLSGAQIVSDKHMPVLLKLSKHLEELGLGNANLSMADIQSFFTDGSAPAPCTLHYLDLTSVSSITQPALFFHSSGSSRVDADHARPLPLLLGEVSLPLEVIELSPNVISDLQRMSASNARFGWTVREVGRRHWYVRCKGSATHKSDPAGGRARGERWWKMGSRSWGMKKVPTVVGEVGGIYGHHMFGK